MGLLRKAVRRSTPRSVRKAMHPVRTTRRAVTPRVVKRATHAGFVVLNPVGAAKGALEDALLDALSPGKRHRSSASRPRAAPVRDSDAYTAVAQEVELLEAMLHLHARPIPANPLVEAPALPEVDERKARLQVSSLAVRGVPFYRLSERRQRRDAARAVATEEVKRERALRADLHAAHVARVERARARIAENDPGALIWAMGTRLTQLPIQAAPIRVADDAVAIGLVAPSPDIVGDKTIAETPTGRPSIKARTQTRRSELYLEVLASAALLAIRTAAQEAPNARRFQLIAARPAEPEPEIVLAVEMERSELGETARAALPLLSTGGQCVFRTRGRTHEVCPLAASEPLVGDLVAATAAIEQNGLPDSPFDFDQMRAEVEMLEPAFAERLASAAEDIGRPNVASPPPPRTDTVEDTRVRPWPAPGNSELSRAEEQPRVMPTLPREKASRRSTLGLVLGIGSIPLSILIVGVAAAAAAIVLGTTELQRGNEATRKRARIAVATGSVGVLVVVVLLIVIRPWNS